MLESDSFALVEGFFLPFSFKAVVHSRKEAFWQTLFMVAFWGHEGVSLFTEISSASSVALSRASSGGGGAQIEAKKCKATFCSLFTFHVSHWGSGNKQVSPLPLFKVLPSTWFTALQESLTEIFLGILLLILISVSSFLFSSLFTCVSVVSLTLAY